MKSVEILPTFGKQVPIGNIKNTSTDTTSNEIIHIHLQSLRLFSR